jgi:hypothetical protein
LINILPILTLPNGRLESERSSIEVCKEKIAENVRKCKKQEQKSLIPDFVFSAGVCGSCGKQCAGIYLNLPELIKHYEFGIYQSKPAN